MTLAEKLLKLRTDKGLSQGELAERLDVSRQSVSKWETGQSVPDLDKIIKLADLFGVTVDDLVRAEGRPQPEPSTPQVIYVEKKQSFTPAQTTGAICEALCAGLVLIGLLEWPPLVLFGLAFLILGLPLLLAGKHPFLISGWLLAAMSCLVLNPWVLGVPWVSIFIPLVKHGHFYRVSIIPLARDILIVVLAVQTWRAVRKKKD